MSIAAKAKIDPRIGPIQGVQPNPKAAPTTKGKAILLLYRLVKNLNSLFIKLKLINPKLIVALGRIAAMTLLRSKDSLTNMRNKIHKYENIDLIATYHPAALLRNPNFKKPTWEDFKLIRDKYINGNK